MRNLGNEVDGLTDRGVTKLTCKVRKALLAEERWWSFNEKEREQKHSSSSSIMILYLVARQPGTRNLEPNLVPRVSYLPSLPERERRRPGNTSRRTSGNELHFNTDSHHEWDAGDSVSNKITRKTSVKNLFYKNIPAEIGEMLRKY